MRFASYRAGALFCCCPNDINIACVDTGMIQHMRSAETRAEFGCAMDYGPETLSKVIVINAPFGVSAVWRTACLFLPPRTRSKFFIYGRNFGPDLIRLVGEDAVPSCYGGRAEFEWALHPAPPHKQ